MGHVQNSRCGSFIFSLTWIVFHFLSSTNGQEIELKLQDRLFVALKGENVSILYHLKKPLNQSEASLTCLDPNQQTIYRRPISAGESEIKDTFILNNLALSGEYYCQYETLKASWFLRVRDSGYKEVWSYSQSEVIVVSVVTGLLLIFSVGGSIYVFRGNWGCCKTLNSTPNRDVRQEETEHTTNGEPAQSTSFYASLEARPRSVYDVLDHSASASARDHTKGKKPKKKEAQNTARETPQKEDEGVFESVYENF